MPAASRMVGTTSMTWMNCSRRLPLSLIRAGHDTTMFWLMPPSCGVKWTPELGPEIAEVKV